MKKKIIFVLIILSFLGFLDAIYLTFHHYQNTTPTCTLKQGCDIVLTSKFSTLGTFPIALLGAIYYFLVVVYSLFLFKVRKRLILLGFVALVSLGFFISIILFLIQAFLLKAFCLYCVGSEIISTLLLIFSVILLRLKHE